MVIDSQRHTLEALATPENRAGMARAVALLERAESLGVFGIGASGIVAQYAARLFDRAGLPGFAYTATGIGLAEQLLSMRPGQVVPCAKSEHVALHAQSIIAVEALHLALAGRTGPRTLATLDRLLHLRTQIRPNTR